MKALHSLKTMQLSQFTEFKSIALRFEEFVTALGLEVGSLEGSLTWASANAVGGRSVGLG